MIHHPATLGTASSLDSENARSLRLFGVWTVRATDSTSEAPIVFGVDLLILNSNLIQFMYVRVCGGMFKRYNLVSSINMRLSVSHKLGGM